MKLTKHEESQLRRAFGVIVDETPLGRPFEALESGQPGAQPPDSHPRPARKVWVGAAVFVMVLVAFVPVSLLLLRGDVRGVSGPAATLPPVSQPPTQPASTLPVSPTSTTLPEPEVSDYGPYPSEIIRSKEGSTTVAALRGCYQPGACASAWWSKDGGSTWAKILTSDENLIDLIDITPTGAILAITNSNDIIRGTLGSVSVVNGPPQVHRLEPDNDQSEIIDLVRPGLPVSDLAPITAESAGDCPIWGLQNWVDASAIAVGRHVVVLGDQRVVGEGICDDLFQVVWTSPDGHDWTLPTRVNVDGYISSMFWYQDRYVAYGSSFPWSSPKTRPAVWSSPDGLTWNSVPLPALPDLPEGSDIWVAVRTDWSIGPDNTIVVRYPVWHYTSEIDSSITDLDHLQQWFTAMTGRPQPELAKLLSDAGIAFPLDQSEIDYLQTTLGQADVIGQVIFTSRDGFDWNVRYRPDTG